VRVILALDMGDRDTAAADSRREDLPVAWIKKEGEGRLFYTNFGHRNETWYDKEFLTHLIKGIQTATGDIEADFTPIVEKPDSPHKRKTRFLGESDALKKFEIQDGYQIELAAGDDMLKEPVMVAWDGNGVMYVAQMETYMQDAIMTGEKDPVCSVLRLEDTNWDGVIDKRTVFAKGLILPRKLICLDGTVIIGETDTKDLYAYKDTDNDGVADTKTRVYEGGPQGGNMEHQPQGYIWNIDNTINGTNSPRFVYKDGKISEGEKNAGFGGQWGITQNETGQIFTGSAGDEKASKNFQQPHIYGSMAIEGEKSEKFYEVWPIDNVPDSQGGPNRVRDNNTLNHFTAVAGAEVYRGGIFPELQNELFLAEPVGRLIRRCKIENKGGMRILHNAYPGSEFIRSSDPNFRPVNLNTGPDGSLYIVDMYRGIIQQGVFARPGGYLYRINSVYGMDKNIGRGRIYRVTKKDRKTFPRPNMLNESSTELLRHLEHKNGWWRITAQKLIVIRQEKSVIPALEKMLLTSTKPLARLHALWTLDGLGATKLENLKKSVKDSDPALREASIRLLEPFLKNDRTLVSSLLNLKDETDSQVVIQMKNTFRALNYKAELKSLYETHRNKHFGLAEMEKVHIKNAKEAEARRLAREKADEAKRKILDAGETHYKALCQSCHAEDGMGTLSGQVKLGAPLVGSPRVNGDIKRLTALALKGLQGPVQGVNYGIMLPLENNSDKYISEVLSYIRTSWGNKSSMVTEQQVKETRGKLSSVKKMFTLDSLYKMYPNEIKNRRSWKISGNTNKDELDRMVDGNKGSRWSTGQSMANGQWVQIELPEAKKVNGLILDQGKSKNDFPGQFKVQLSMDGKKWSTEFLLKGSREKSVLRFQETESRFIKITCLEENKGNFWSIHELEITQSDF
ncbi:MAG: discoidin domain-containing protein, partial [Lentisphaeraceae bacterium]|nr:discoidin domain-containing protein [Lentisphaeraceae bacterium]